jgi:hypothetical protein
MEEQVVRKSDREVLLLIRQKLEELMQELSSPSAQQETYNENNKGS